MHKRNVIYTYIYVIIKSEIVLRVSKRVLHLHSSHDKFDICLVRYKLRNKQFYFLKL